MKVRPFVHSVPGDQTFAARFVELLYIMSIYYCVVGLTVCSNMKFVINLTEENKKSSSEITSFFLITEITILV